MSSLFRVAIVVACGNIFGIPIVQSGQLAQTSEMTVMSDKSKSECSARVKEFVSQLDKLLSTEHSVDPIQRLFRESFPLKGCDPDEVVKLCRQSRYFGEVTNRPTLLVISFDNRISDPHSGMFVQFGLNKRSGDSELPFVKVKM